MRYAIIAAMDRQQLIGKNNALPWHLPADLKHFKALTMGKPIIMGRKTYASIGRPLPGRTTIVLSRDTGVQLHDEVILTHTLNDALDVAQDAARGMGAHEAMIVGGADIYFQSLPWVDRMYLTMVHGTFSGDAYFPAYDRRDFGVIHEEHHPADEVNSSAYSFITLERCHRHAGETVSFTRW
ncbi:MAG TPA: dihydrofolate reductase [bacterium]|nr:dihydrofolate reductase [bacterium]